MQRILYAMKSDEDIGDEQYMCVRTRLRTPLIYSPCSNLIGLETNIDNKNALH